MNLRARKLQFLLDFSGFLRDYAQRNLGSDTLADGILGMVTAESVVGDWRKPHGFLLPLNGSPWMIPMKDLEEIPLQISGNPTDLAPAPVVLRYVGRDEALLNELFKDGLIQL